MTLKVFVSTSKGQGLRDDDFCYVPDGEIVLFPVMECDNPKCGCQWAMNGIERFTGTTTFKATRFNGTRAELSVLVLEGLARAGWLKNKGVEASEEIADMMTDEMLEMASSFRIGLVLERRGDCVQSRNARRRKA